MRIRTGLALGLLLAVITTGCAGADGNDGVATTGKTAKPTSSASADAQSQQEALLKYSQCMRENGVPDFPDPKIGDSGGVSLDLPAGTDSKKVDAASEKCKQFMPNGGEPQKIDPQRLEELREYSQCMRDNGVKNFPDPTDQGLQINGNEIDPNDPKVKAAESACAKLMPAPPPGAPSPGTNTGGNG